MILNLGFRLYTLFCTLSEVIPKFQLLIRPLSAYPASISSAAGVNRHRRCTIFPRGNLFKS